MRPYLALLHDSLREAMYSRVLWLLLGLIVLVVVAIAPIGVTYPLSSTIFRADLRDVSSFSRQLIAASKFDETTPSRKIWNSLDESLRNDLNQFATTDEPIRALEMSVNRQLRGALNEIIDQPDFFSSDDFAKADLPAEGQALVNVDRSDQQQKRLNRLMVEDCFPEQLEQRSGSAAQVSYLIWPVGTQIPVGRNQVEQFVDVALTGFTNFFLGFIGVFSGILVTASIIPNTLETGSVNLLLSKPISRTLLYLTKIIGGCWFVLFNGTVLVMGVWAVAGLRLGTWNHRLLLTIPLFLFVFLVYYSVSALAGLIWRNTVIAIVVTVVFWLVCFLVGTARELIRDLALQPQRLIAVIRAGDQIASLTESGGLQRWDAEQGSWQQIFTSDAKTTKPPEFARQNQILGPCYDSDQQRLLAIQRGWSPELIQSSAAEDWRRIKIGSAPRESRDFFMAGRDKFFVLARDGISTLTSAETRKTPFSILSDALPALAGRLIPKNSKFKSLGPDGEGRLTQDAAAHVVVVDDKLQCAAIDKQQLRIYDLDAEDKFRPSRSIEFGQKDDRYLIGGAGAFWLVVDQTGLVRVLDRGTLTQVYEERPFGRIEPRFVTSSANGDWLAITFHDGNAWLYDTKSKRDATSMFPRHGFISCVCFTPDNTVLVADRTFRVREVSLADGETLATLQPAEPLLFRAYRYLLNPVYRIFPRPGELANTNQYLLTQSKSLTLESDLRESRPVVDPWAPVWNSAIFALIVIGFGCVYISRVEF